MNDNSASLQSPQLEAVTLRKGDRNADVTQLQRSLKQFGYDCGAIDGNFGDRTEAAVKELQQHFELAEDGVFGSMTWYALSFWTPEEGKTPQEALVSPWAALGNALLELLPLPRGVEGA